MALDVLKDIVACLQQQVVAPLETQVTQDTFLQYAALQDVSDACQDRCILALMQLQQRIITFRPIDNATSPPLKQANSYEKDLPAPPNEPSSPEPSEEFPSLSDIHASVPAQNPSSPPRSPTQSRPKADSRATARRTFSPERVLADVRPPRQTQYRPMATTVKTTGLFGLRKKTKVEPVVQPPENPLVDEYLATAILDEYRGMERAERMSCVSTTGSSTQGSIISDGSDTGVDRYREQGSRTPTSPKPKWHRKDSQLSRSLLPLNGSSPDAKANLEVLTSNRSLSSINAHDLLPSEMNAYAGFCKGAWRQQIGDRKRAMEERVRPGGMYNSARYWQCRHCKFEGRIVVSDSDSAAPKKNKKVGSGGIGSGGDSNSKYDMRVFCLVDGIQFRWEFMFKSHLPQKDPLPDPTKSRFACIFCCAEGSRAPTFEGLESFMRHLVEHRDPLPTGDVLYRMNCLVGRRANPEEDFDINFVSREGGLL